MIIVILKSNFSVSSGLSLSPLYIVKVNILKITQVKNEQIRKFIIVANIPNFAMLELF